MSAPVPPEVVEVTIEAVIEALYDVLWPEGEPLLSMARKHMRRLAAAAIAAMPPSPAEEAVKRVEALAEELDRFGAALRLHSGGAIADRIRAAVASPAPAPHDIGTGMGEGVQ